MRIVTNNMIPFKGYGAITIWPFIFARNTLSRFAINHENIHGEQQKEMLLVFFYIWYAIEYIVRLVIYRNHKEAYHNISFEQEAYIYQYDTIQERKHFIWLKYVTKKNF